MKAYNYFAYGSNISRQRLENRVGKVTVLGKAKLYGYKLIFNAGEGKANVIKTGNSKGKNADYVEGVIYELTRIQLKILDFYEGSPVYYNRVVDRIGIHNVHLYIALNQLFCSPENRCLPSDKEYIDHIRKGCVENNFIKTLKILQKVKIKVTSEPIFSK